MQSLKTFAIVAVAAVSFSGCAILQSGKPIEEKPRQSIFGPKGLSLSRLGNINTKTEQNLGVNSYLWRACLNVLKATELPLASSDPFGGAITTEWGALAQEPETQFKITTYVDSPQLKASSLRVVLHKRIALRGGGWKSVAVDPQAVRKIENSILRRARDLRNNALIQ